MLFRSLGHLYFTGLHCFNVNRLSVFRDLFNWSIQTKYHLNVFYNCSFFLRFILGIYSFIIIIGQIRADWKQIGRDRGAAHKAIAVDLEFSLESILNIIYIVLLI